MLVECLDQRYKNRTLRVTFILRITKVNSNYKWMKED